MPTDEEKVAETLNRVLHLCPRCEHPWRDHIRLGNGMSTCMYKQTIDGYPRVYCLEPQCPPIPWK